MLYKINNFQIIYSLVLFYLVFLERFCSTASSGSNLVIRPWPIVFPESLKANLKPSSTKTGELNLILILILSPGIPIETSSGNLISEATSQVLK